jgi:hypothetical protein
VVTGPLDFIIEAMQGAHGLEKRDFTRDKGKWIMRMSGLKRNVWYANIFTRHFGFWMTGPSIF